MDEILHLTLLYDFYGELLTQKQKQAFELHYQYDLSLSEIGTELSISRQAVRDQLKRTENILLGYEEKLGLVKRFQEQKKAVQKMREIMEDMETDSLTPQRKKQMEDMKQIAQAILSFRRFPPKQKDRTAPSCRPDRKYERRLLPAKTRRFSRFCHSQANAGSFSISPPLPYIPD